jgi:hypothetical protein
VTSSAEACSFCGKRVGEPVSDSRPELLVRYVIEGPKVFICDDCVSLSVEILDENGLGDRVRADAWEDVRDEWTPHVDAAHPARDSGSHEEYGVAMRMVGHRHSKWQLVALVNWLLVLIARGEKLPTGGAR